MPFPIHDRTARLRLESRAKPYFMRLSTDISLGYRRGKTLSRWVIQRRNQGRSVMHTLDDVIPDDRLPTDGLRVLAFHQVVEKVMSAKSVLSCSFWGKSRHVVDKLIAGPDVYICDRCVRLCQCYLDHPEEKGKVLLDDGKPVMKDGRPVFIPLTEEEERKCQELLEE